MPANAATSWQSLVDDHCLVIWPVFFAYLLGSFASLRFWIAARQAPAAIKADTREEAPAEIPTDNRKQWLIYVLACLMLSALGYFVFGVSFFSWIFAAFLTIALTAPLSMWCADYTGLQSYVHRNFDGILWIEPFFKDTMDTVSLWTAILMGGVISVITVWYHSDMGASMVVFTMLYIFVNYNGPCTLPMHVVMTNTILSLTQVLSVFVLIFCFTKAGDVEMLREFLTPECERFLCWVFILLMAVPLCFIIPMSLRLDFSNHIANAMARQEVHMIVLEAVPAAETPMFSSKLRSAGVVIPSNIPFTFKCPYFVSALLAWLLANAAVMVLLARGWLPDHGSCVYAFWVFVCALPMVVMSVLAVSLVRGEVMRMLRYEEHWSFRPDKEQVLMAMNRMQDLSL